MCSHWVSYSGAAATANERCALTQIMAPDAGALARIAGQFGVEPSGIRQLPAGEANHAWLLGDELVLRIPRDSGPLADDLRKERVVIPIARGAGVRTPEIVAFEEHPAGLGVPYMVLRRVSGADIERLTLPATASEAIYREVGRQLAVLHNATVNERVASSLIPVDTGRHDPRLLLPPIVRDGGLDGETAEWLRSWFDRLAPFVPDDPPVVLIHGDIAPRNLMVDPASGEFRAVIDWGDAALAEPAMDFAKLPLAMLPATLEGYLGHDDWSGDDLRSWQARAFRYHLHWAVAAIDRRVPETGSPRPPGPAMARLLVVLRFLADTTDDRWRWRW